MKLKSIVKVVLTAISITVFIIGISIVNVEAQLQTEGAEESDELKVLIKEIVFEGNTVIDTPTLEKVTEPYRDRELTLGEMSELVDLVTITYQEKGYILARAYLPRQDIKDGVLKIGIVEGNIGKIIIAGKTHYSDRVLKRYFKKQVKHGIVNESLIERGLLFQDEIPKIKMDVTLKKSEKPGEVDVVLNTKDDSDLTFGLDLGFDSNNFGPKLISRNRYGATINIAEHKWGSTLRLRGMMGDYIKDTLMFGANLAVPVNSYGTKVSGQFLEAGYAIGGEFEAYGIKGTTQIHGAEISHPLLKKKNMNLGLALGWNRKRVVSELADKPSRRDRLDAGYVGLNFDNLDRYMGKNILSFNFYTGKIDYSEDLDSEPPNRDPIEKLAFKYDRIKLEAARVQKVPFFGYTNLLVRGSGQYSPDRLVPVEQVSIGGYGSVRGFDPAIYIGDSGYNASAELMFAPPYFAEKTIFGQRIAQMVQFSVFYDVGGVYITDFTPSDDDYSSQVLQGYGAGIRLFYKDSISFTYNVGFPVRKIQDSDLDMFHYFQASINFF